jgi:DNA-binding NarL/FixJ family response regulator
MRKAVRQILEAHEGWTVCCEAQDGLDAIQQAEECKPDLVLLDLSMPHINGLITATRISKLLPGIAIVMLTLYDSPYLRADAKNVGILQVICKSDLHSLTATIEALTQKTRTPETTVAETLPPPLIKSTGPQLT